jgi:hypothetical protein
MWHIQWRGEVFTRFWLGDLKGRDHWHRREDNIEMELWEIGIDGVNWIQLAQDRIWWQALESTVISLHVP